MRNRTVIIATNAHFLADTLVQKIADNGLQVFISGNDIDLEEKIKSTYPKFIFIENCFHGHATDVYIQKLAKHNRYLRVVVWAACEVKPRIVARYIEAGADSFFSLRDTDKNINNILNVITEGRYCLPADVETFLDKDTDTSLIGNELTKREIEIIKISASGKSNKKIGEILALSINTIKTHRKNIYRKCGGNTNFDILRNGLIRGLITVEDII